MRKVLILAAVLGLGALTSCGGGGTVPTPESSPKPVQQPSFSIADTNVTVVNDGTPASQAVKIVRTNGHSEPITFALSGQPESLTATFAKNPIASSEAVATLTLIAKNTPPNEYKVKLVGTSASATASATITVRVVTPQQISIPDPSYVSAYFSTLLNQVSVTWNSVSGATGYRIDRQCGTDAFAELTTSPLTTQPFIDKSPVLGATCVYRVRAVTPAGISIGKTASVSTVVEAAYVSAASNSTSVVVVWGTVAGATGYKIDRKLVDGNYAELASLPATSVSYTDTAVTAGQSYVYRVRIVAGSYVSAGKESNVLVFTGAPGSGGSACCKICTTGKPCGDTCIPVSKTCHTPGGCACNVVRPLVYQRIKDCGKAPAVGLDVNGKETYLGTVEDWLKSVPNH